MTIEFWISWVFFIILMASEVKDNREHYLPKKDDSEIKIYFYDSIQK